MDALPKASSALDSFAAVSGDLTGIVEAIAKKSLERKTGARGLRAIMEDTMMDLMYEIPSDNTTKECVITKDAVEKKAEPEIIHGEPAPVPRRNMGRRSGRPETA